MTRPVPRDFEQRWPELGWSGAEAYWSAHARSIVRWLDDAGRDRLIAERSRFLREQRELRARLRQKGYRLE